MRDFGLKSVGTDERLALRGVEASARITGLIATTSLVQRYENDTATNLELAYTFPLPVEATLLSFTVSIGDRKYEGRVVARQEAEVKYEKAVGDGHSAFRLQKISNGIYSATLGNVMPCESVEIAFSFAEPLGWNGRSMRYRLPTTIAPRYGNPYGMQPWQRPEASLVAEYPLSVSVSITGELASSSVSCPSHKVGMRFHGDALRLELAEGATLDRDFVLDIENEEIRSVGAIASDGEAQVAMLTLLPPGGEDQAVHRDVVLVLDCSGSMQGDSLELAKEGLLLALGSLAADERFGIVAFGTNFLVFDESLQPANRKNLDMGRRWIQQLNDLGGTDIDGAVERALNLKGTGPMDVLLLTDGQDWEAGNAIQKAKNQGVRIFTVGIGSAVAEESVRQMADETGGACELISPNENMSQRIYRHFSRMRQPELKNLVIDWPAPPIWEVRPERACFAGDAYTVFARLPSNASNSTSVTYDFALGGAQSVTVRLDAETEYAHAIVRLGARHRLEKLPESEQAAWAVRYQLMTKLTDYLISVEREASDMARDLPELLIQPNMLPAGWGGTSSVRYSPVRSGAGVDACFSPTGVSAADSMDAAAFSSVTEVSCVLRKRPSVSSRSGLGDGNYAKFIENLQAFGSRKLFAFVPEKLDDLRAVLPPEIDEIIARFSDRGISENDVLASFYEALLEHDGNGRLEAACKEECARAAALGKADRDLKNEIAECLNMLFVRGNMAVLGSGAIRYDNPAFLRSSGE